MNEFDETQVETIARTQDRGTTSLEPSSDTTEQFCPTVHDAVGHATQAKSAGVASSPATAQIERQMEAADADE